MKVESGLAAVAQTAGVGVAGRFKTSVASSVRIGGAMGPNVGAINGMYQATAEMSDGMPVYVKVGNGDLWLEYRLKTWQVKTTSAKGTDGCMALCVVPAQCLPEECPKGQWKIVVNDKFVTLPAIVASVVTREEVDAYRAQMEEEAARVLKGSHNVTITGATGTLADYINGIYKPTEELWDNVTVYVKVGDPDKCFVYRSSFKQWQVKPTADKGSAGCLAVCAVPVKCLPEDCPRGKWLVDDGAKRGPQHTVTISVQHDNSDAVSTDDFDDDEAKPKAAAMKVDTGVDLGIISPAASRCVRIVGAMGPHAGRVNGMYEPTEEFSGDMPVYVKLGDADKLLEYCAPKNQWQVKPTASKGTAGCLVSCIVPTTCLPEECPPGQWQACANRKFVPLPAIGISVVTREEVGAYRAQVEDEAARVVKGGQHVYITGATGLPAGRINGMYRPTQELRDNVTVYAKVGDGDTWLEYRADIKDWQVKPTRAKGTIACLACCTVPVKCLPDKCPLGQWRVFAGETFLPQPAVTIKQKKRER